MLVTKQEARLASGHFQLLTFGIHFLGNSLNSQTNSETLTHIKQTSA